MLRQYLEWIARGCEDRLDVMKQNVHKKPVTNNEM